MKTSSKHLSIFMAFMLLLSILPFGAGLAQNASGGMTFESVTNANDMGSVTYPQLTGYALEDVQNTINQDIYTKSEIASHLEILADLDQGGWGLQVTYTGAIEKDVLSVLISAIGEMPSGQFGQTYTTVNYNLSAGTPIAVSDLFTDEESAFAFMEQQLEDNLRPELSGYLENDGLSPIPRDNFFLTPYSITFYYPQDQFSMISGYSGGCTFYYYELKDYLRLDAGSPLALLGVGDTLSITGNTAALTKQTVEEGVLPGIPARLGDSLISILDEYRLLVDPDYYPGGRFFELEAPEFRNAWLLTDDLTESYDQSLVLGIRADRINLYGIQPGVTTKDEWRMVLGTPNQTVALDESTASDYRLPAGESDYYTFGANTLRLCADESGLLASVHILR